MWDQYFAPKSLNEAVQILSEYRGRSRIVAGATDLILEIENGQRPDIDCLIDITRIPELDRITCDDDGLIHLGPLVTHNHCVNSALIREQAFCLTKACWEVGSPQLRNRGTVAGNLITASPANDTIPPLMALDARVVLLSASGTRTLPLSEFYTGVRKTVMREDEMLADIIFPAPPTDARSTFLKLGLRKANAISLVSVAVVLVMDGARVSHAAITLGSVAPTVIHAQASEQHLVGKTLTDEVLEAAGDLASRDCSPIDDVRASAWYRKHMVGVYTRRSLRLLADGEERSGFPQKPVALRRATSWHRATPLDKSYRHQSGEPIKTMINGQPLVFHDGQNKTLLRLLREHSELMGTKDACSEGECGSCTIFLDGMAVLACLVPAPRAHGAEIVTVEGLSHDGKLHPIQQGFVEEGAVQCGYCTPGLLMSGAMLLDERPSITSGEIKQAIAGNLCRCTGYYQILSAFEKAVSLSTED
jgi:xanthine dehydrogenase iron-sulfur cluster and FAD-binding subunit A